MALSPGTAAVASLVLPGLGHILVGKVARGVVAFVVTVGAFGLGFVILQDRLWSLQAVPLGGIGRIFPVLLLPEFVNLAPTVIVAALREAEIPDVGRHLLLPRDGELFAMTLTGFSGILSALWACDAWWQASARSVVGITPPAAAAISWIVPGAGHVLAGQRSKGLLVGAAVLITFVAGLAFGAGNSVDRAAMPFWWAGQSLCGIGTVFATFVTSPLKAAVYPEMLDLGVILCTIAGLMNVMVMTDAFAVAERRAVEPTAEAV